MSQSEQISKEQLMEKQKEQEPSVEVNLPTGGMVYPEDSPMGDGSLTMRYMKGEDEEILISPKYAKSGKTFSVLLNRLILEANFNPDQLTIADREYLILSARIISLGDDFEAENVQCPNCGHTQEKVGMKLSDIKENPILHKPDEPHTNRFTTTLEQTKDKVTLKVLTGGDQKEIQKKFESSRFGNDGEILTYSMAQAIVEAPNVGDNFGHKVKYYKDLPLRDARQIRNYLEECAGGTDFAIDFHCPNCDSTQETTIDFGLGFFF